MQVLAGRSVDWATKEPIAGAKVVFDCSADATNRIEGHDHWRTVTHLTDSDGRYEFSSSDLKGCTLFRFIGSKEDYSGAKLSYEDKLSLQQSQVSFTYDGKSWSGRMSDYDEEVVPYCDNP